MKRDLARVLDAARARGWVVDRTRSGHHRLRHASGALVFAASTPSCWRALRNVASDIRRVERASMQETAP